jgi:predicted nuclease of predicted toxin-antitoxin system
MSISFLADENISPETADYLAALGFPCRSLRREGPWRLTDREIAALARREGLVILTHDLDFGEIFYLAQDGQVGIVVLRLHRQTVEAVNDVLARFLGSGVPEAMDLPHSLVILSETHYRVYHGPRGQF